MTDASSRSAGIEAVATDQSVPVLRFEHVTAGYGATEVLREVSLSVCPGQVVALLGPNGAGKTTCLRVAAGILQPKTGTVLLNGKSLKDVPPYRRVNGGLCLIPEGRAVFRSLTVLENLSIHVRRSRIQEQDLHAALEIFPALGDRLNVTAANLSGGQQQMLALARAYITNPKVILLDEPSMGLAPLVVEEIFRALRTLASTGVAMLLVEQYVSKAIKMSDHVVLLQKGTVVYSGPPAALDESRILSGYLGVDVTSGSRPQSEDRSPEIAQLVARRRKTEQ